MKTYLEYIKEAVQELNPKYFFDVIDKNSDKLELEITFEPDDIDKQFPDFNFYLNNLHRFKIVTVSELTVRIRDIFNNRVYKIDCIESTKELTSKLAKYLFKFVIRYNIDDILEFLEGYYPTLYVIELQKFIKNSYEFQKKLIEEGYIPELKGLKINPKILEEYPEMKDIKKQTEWS